MSTRSRQHLFPLEDRGGEGNCDEKRANGDESAKCKAGHAYHQRAKRTIDLNVQAVGAWHAFPQTRARGG